jgi:hypothetical protein
MKFENGLYRQGGVALIVALLFLLVITIISVIAASNSTQGLRMAANMQDSAASFQAAEAGVTAALTLAYTPEDPFGDMDELEPFADFDPATDHPLRNVYGGPGSVDVDVFVTGRGLPCPRSGVGSSVGLLECNYYRVTSEHAVAGKARTGLQMGVVRTTIGGGVR